DQLAILLGGPMAEEIALGRIASGAQNELEKASDIARTMVCSLGMSKKMGPLTYGKRQQLQFLETETSEYRNYSDVTARLIDTEIIALVEEAETRAREIISANRSALEQLAQVLQEKEVINRDEMMALLGKL
ncbi:MAG: cell division protein FtsH, partial [Methylobacter sp.]|nr:cell division protein FtsH [Methylobacter sp.]